ncbi:phage holin family protein [Amphibacillus sp. MSJ-3]|uniref:phage holin family protein n=1 Tax=Amphibacillus sp. MSJ-3 TaxID=2841505 RepID=UPI001C0F3934|nr:phage holin family protein [Amphibacillus sp. MSJ-3]MBU5593974.1 phage holin family protein [Amphibacillus sp. MSJ-3]
MTRWILSLILDAVTLLIVAEIFSGFHVETFWVAILASLILSILNIIVKPILVFFTLPITIVSLGLFLFVINAITLMLTQAIMGPDFVIESFGLAIIASIFISIINLFLNKLVKDTVLMSK